MCYGEVSLSYEIEIEEIPAKHQTARDDLMYSGKTVLHFAGQGLHTIHLNLQDYCLVLFVS